MQIECPECRQHTKIRDEKIPKDSFLVRCTHCKALLQVAINVAALKLVEDEPVKVVTACVDRLAKHYDLRQDPVYLGSKTESLERIVLDKFLSGEIKLPVLPAVAVRVNRLVNDGSPSGKDLADAVGIDRNIAARVLMMANSASYRSQGPIQDLDNAIARLGFKTVESVVLASVVRGLFKTDFQPLARLMEVDWEHSITCAITAFEIASRTRFRDKESAFTAGLLLDIGNVVCAEILAALAAEQPQKFKASEDEIASLLVGLHVILGCPVLKNWSIPESIARAVACHHESEDFEDTLVDIVSLANAICVKIGKSLAPNPQLSLTSLIAAQRLEFTDLTLASIEVELEDRVRDMKAILD